MQLSHSELAERYIDLRIEKGLKQSELAKAIGINVNTIRLLEEEHRTISARPLQHYADYFGVSTDYLLGRTNVRTPNITTQAVCKKTGLSEEALESIKMLLLQEYMFFIGENPTQTCNGIFANENFRKALLGTVFMADRCHHFKTQISESVINDDTYCGKSTKYKSEKKLIMDAEFKKIKAEYYSLREAINNTIDELSGFDECNKFFEQISSQIDCLPIEDYPASILQTFSELSDTDGELPF